MPPDGHQWFALQLPGAIPHPSVSLILMPVKQRVSEVSAGYLRAYCVAARTGSVTAAARELGLSQPAISRQLLLLSEAHGAPLYRRKGAGIELTPAGKALLPFACEASEALSRAQRFLSGELQEDGVRLRIGLSHHLTTRFTGPLLQAAREYNRQGNLLRLHLLEAYSDDLIAALQSATIDAAFLIDEQGLRTGPGNSETVTQPIGSERAVLLVKSDDSLAAEPQSPLSVLQGETLIVPSFASTMYRHVLSELAAAGVRPGRSIEVSGPAAVRSAVLDGLGIGVTIESFVRPEVAAGTLRVIHISTPGTTMNVMCQRRDDSHLFPDQQDALTYLLDQLPEE